MSELMTYEKPTIVSLEGREILESIGPAMAGPSGGPDLGASMDPYGGAGFGGGSSRRGSR
ncbi:hypothetical protein ABI59_09670 [Acidobacteria bacterium Mor1]|nr:hypothetical protein ABI59_09670 [Acidobacteria bacterium Mor1]